MISWFYLSFKVTLAVNLTWLLRPTLDKLRHLDELNKFNKRIPKQMTIGKGELISQIAQDIKMDKAIIQQILEAYFDQTKKLLQEGKEIRILGFGIYRVQDIAERQGINPKTQEKLTIPVTLSLLL